MKQKELALIATDSDYWKEFNEWKNTKGYCYDGNKEKAPMYVHADRLISELIKRQEQFMKPHKERLSSILSSSQAE